jgi:hypothetical protein
MYNFPADLDLSHLIGCEVVEISFVPYNIFIRLEPANHINMIGAWKIIDSKGNLIDEGNVQGDQKESYRVHKLLSLKIKAYKITSPTILSIIFDNDWVLEIIDDSDQYETCAISPNIYI